MLSVVNQERESCMHMEVRAAETPTTTTTVASSTTRRTVRNRARVLWQRIINRVHEEISNRNAIVLHPERIYGRLPVTIFSRPLVSRWCGRCVSRPHRAFMGRSSLVLAVLCGVCYVVGALIACFALIGDDHDVLFVVATTLLLPQYVLWVLLMEDTLIWLVLRNKLVWLYMFICMSWTALLAHLMGNATRVLYVVVGCAPGTMLVTWIDATRQDAYYFRRVLPFCYIAGGAVLFEMWLLLLSGELTLRGSPIEFTLNISMPAAAAAAAAPSVNTTRIGNMSSSNGSVGAVGGLGAAHPPSACWGHKYCISKEVIIFSEVRVMRKEEDPLCVCGMLCAVRRVILYVVSLHKYKCV